MVTREGSNSRAARQTCAYSPVRPNVVAHATTSIAIEAGEEFEEFSNSELDHVCVAPVDDPMWSSGDEFDE